MQRTIVAAVLVAFFLVPAWAEAVVPEGQAAQVALQPPAVEPVPAFGDAGEPPEALQTQRELERADREDSKRGLQFFWIRSEAGFALTKLSALSDTDLVEVPLRNGTGLALGGASGVRLLFFTLGARFRYSLLDNFDSWTLGGELGFRVPMGRFEPHASLGLGYARVNGFSNRASLALTGMDVGLALGADFFVTPAFSVGLKFESQALFLSRKANAALGETYQSSGSGIGLQLLPGLVLGLHY